MSSQVSRRPGSTAGARRRETVDRLLAAGEAELREVGVEGLTVRTVAQRAGVSPATAYTHLASKNHLFAELFLRALTRDGQVVDAGTTVRDRLHAVHARMANLLRENPHLATASNVALLSSDPDVEELRLRIGAVFARDYAAALGEAHDPAVLDALLLAFSGALLQAGMGLITYGELADRLDRVAATILEGHA
jgi:AcrR family transcriptional regulator